jgi:NADH:flavin oxidoreductases, Old Yellow Enzyme family
MNSVFDEIKLNNITIKNRIIRSATNDHLGNFDGTISNEEVLLFKELAKNDVGLIISGHACVSTEGKVDETQNCIYDDKFIPSFSKISDAIKKYNSKMIIQINHGGKKANPIFNDGKISVGPSEDENTRALSIAEIKEIERDFIDAAYRLKKAGMDGVQVHLAHGYLLSQFISIVTNKRTDEYGGKIENRFRIAKNIVQGIKAKCGNDFPVFIKINSNQEIEDVQYEEDLIYITKECKLIGVEAIEFSGYNFSKVKYKNGKPFYIERIAKLKSKVDIPMILVGGIKSFEDMESVLRNNIDMVSLSRGFICEPNLIIKLKDGQKQAKCINCNKCFSIFKTEPKRCVFHANK